MFVEQFLKFNAHYGLKADFHSEKIQLQKQINSLKSRKYELQMKIENTKSDIKYFESIETERNALQEDIRYMETKKDKLINENIGLKRTVSRLLSEMQALQDMPNSGQEFLSLRHQLENLKVNENSPIKWHFQKYNELNNDFKNNRQTVETPPQLLTEQQNYGTKGKKLLENIEKIGSKFESEKNINNNTAVMSQNSREKLWERHRRRRIMIQNKSKE
jgi:hypothetical protein